MYLIRYSALYICVFGTTITVFSYVCIAAVKNPCSPNIPQLQEHDAPSKVSMPCHLPCSSPYASAFPLISLISLILFVITPPLHPKRLFNILSRFFRHLWFHRGQFFILHVPFEHLKLSTQISNSKTDITSPLFLPNLSARSCLVRFWVRRGRRQGRGRRILWLFHVLVCRWDDG